MNVFNIDLHYHAGQEREPGVTIADHLLHARLTGRKLVAVTDHAQFYFGGVVRTDRAYPYEFNLAGLQRFHDDVRESAAGFPELRVLFAPELSPEQDLTQVPEQVVRLSDLFFCEAPGVDDSPAENTEACCRRVREIKEFSQRCGKPVFLAHPLRTAVDARVVFGTVPDEILAMEASPELDLNDDLLNWFFLFDIRKVARECARLGIPVEVNGQTQLRLILLNLPVLLDLYHRAYRVLREEGVELVPGSDQHELRTTFGGRGGCQVPWQVFDKLGLGLAEMPLVTHLLTVTGRR